MTSRRLRPALALGFFVLGPLAKVLAPIESEPAPVGKEGKKKR